MRQDPLVLKVLSFATECYDNIRNCHRSGEALKARSGAFYKMELHPFSALVWYPLRSQVLLKNTDEPIWGALLSPTLSSC